MLSLAGKPVLGHLLDSLVPLKPSKLIFIVGERGELVEEYVREHYDIPAEFCVQKEPKGQSHAVKMAAAYISEPLLIVFGDTLFAAPLDQVTDPSVDGSFVVKPVDDPKRFGVVELRDGFVTRLMEKPEVPPSNLAITGVYMFNDYRGLLQAIDDQIASDDAQKGEFFLAGAIQRLIDRGQRFSAVQATEWHDTGTIEAVLDTHRHLVAKHRRHPEFSPVATIIDPCYIDPSAKLERCVIGPYVTVGPHAVITDSVVGDSIIGEEATITGQCMRRSIVGSWAVLESPLLSYNVSDHSSVSSASEGTAS
jgi:glucose-1-phosphate thymidylyltransferase